MCRRARTCYPVSSVCVEKCLLSFSVSSECVGKCILIVILCLSRVCRKGHIGMLCLFRVCRKARACHPQFAQNVSESKSGNSSVCSECVGK